MSAHTAKVFTPCIGLCSTALGDSVCRGCKRFDHEVSHWNVYDDEQRVVVEKRLLLLLEAIVVARVRLLDAALLRRRLEEYGVRFPLHRQGPALIWDLLRAGASSIQQPEDFGFAVRSRYRYVGLSTLREQIDSEFYRQSVAHYQRYFGPIARARDEVVRRRWAEKGVLPDPR